jgi:cation diffusion facilitator family transporter
VKLRHEFELPSGLEPELRRAVRLEWTTLGFMVTIVAAVYLAMGGSQAMKAAWVEDMLSFIPPAAFLISVRFRDRKPNAEFPYGYHRSVSIAFLAGAVALALFGGFILVDSVMTLVHREHPSIGTTVVFGRTIWTGWLMVAALAYSMIPPLVLGRLKLGPARVLHDKTLKADADMNKADWLTGGAGIVGVLGVGLGFWWADPVAAGVISIDIVKDGFQNVKRVVQDLMDQSPTTVDGERSDIVERARAALLVLSWIRDAQVRLREEGHVFTGEAFIVPTAFDVTELPQRFDEARASLYALDWRMHDIVLTVVAQDELTPDGTAQAP